MAGFDDLAARMSTKGEPVGRLLARSGTQLAAQPAVPANPGSTGHSGVSSPASVAAGAGEAAGSAPGGAEGSPGSEAPAPAPEPSLGRRALAAVGEGFAVAIGVEQMLSPVLALMPWPRLRAMCVGDYAIGLPHAHNHPPNIVPPNPVPLPLPSMGPVLGIPFLSGATQTMIEGRPAARCGDMGASIFCGGLFPMYELFLGSSTVWVEGARQAREITDISKHCVFSTPKPSDPPIGPMIGMTSAGTARTLVGGMPFPSLLSMALGALFKGAFKGIGGAIKKLRAPQVALARFLKHATIGGDDAFKAAVKNDLARMARTAEGRTIMDRIVRAGKELEINPAGKGQAYSRPFSVHDGHVLVTPDPNGAHMANLSGTMEPVTITGKGAGSGSEIAYDPASFPNANNPGSPSDVVLAHEMNHSANTAEGGGQAGLKDSDPAWNKKWRNREEKNTVDSENRYREQRGGVPQRPDYANPP